MLLIIIAAMIVIIDQLTKFLVTTNMTEGAGIPVIEGIFHLTFILNPGAAFGILENSRWFFVATAVLVLAVFFYYRRALMREPKPVQLGISLFAGGALGNLIDRIQLGKVVDFLDFYYTTYHWPAFNFADVFIFIGVFVVLFLAEKAAKI